MNDDDLITEAKKHLKYIREEENVFKFNSYTLRLIEKLIKKIEKLKNM